MATAKTSPKPKPARRKAKPKVALESATPAKPKARAPRRKASPPDDDAPIGRSGSLVIVESPTKARTIGKYLGRGYTVKATVGHLRDLPTRKLGVDVDNNFQPEYVTIKGKTQTLSDIKKAARGATAIFLATDPDREGEAIAWHVADQLEQKVPTHRVLFHEITKDAIQEAMRKPGLIDDQKVNAQQARRILDRLVGYKASPLLWKSIKTGLSAGRDRGAAPSGGAGARHPGLRAPGVLDRRSALRQGRPDLRGGAQEDQGPQSGAAHRG
jgi:DNA topoisomerase-1